MDKAFIFIIILFSFQRCSFIAKKGYGAKQPQVETEQSIIAWINKNKLSTEEVVTVDTSGFFNFFSLISPGSAII